MICEHPECTGKHTASFHSSEWCPDFAKKRRERQREYGSRYYRKHREEMCASNRRWRVQHRRAKYVYAILVKDSALKIGCSTAPYRELRKNVCYAYRSRRFGQTHFDDTQMVWHNRGDEGLEIFLQWRAGRIWTPLTKGTRHSEWFDVTGVDADTIRKNLRRWRDQAELPDEEDE